MAKINREEEITKFEENIFQTTNEQAIENIFVEPIIRILREKEEEDKPLIAMVPIPNKIFKNDATKDILTENILPTIVSELKKDGWDPFALSFVSEGWVRQTPADKGKDINLEEFNQIKDTLEKVEVVTVSIESLTSTKNITFYKQGTKKNQNGEWCEGVWLKKGEVIENANFSGRFSNLLRKALKL